MSAKQRENSDFMNLLTAHNTNNVCAYRVRYIGIEAYRSCIHVYRKILIKINRLWAALWQSYIPQLYTICFMNLLCSHFLWLLWVVFSPCSLTHFMQDYRSQWGMLDSAWLSLWCCSCCCFRWVYQSRKWIHHSHLARINKWVYRLCGGSLKLKHISYCLCRSLSEFCVLIIALVAFFEAKPRESMK